MYGIQSALALLRFHFHVFYHDDVRIADGRRKGVPIDDLPGSVAVDESFANTEMCGISTNFPVDTDISTEGISMMFYSRMFLVFYLLSLLERKRERYIHFIFLRMK